MSKHPPRKESLEENPPLNLAGDKAIGDIGHPRATITFNSGAEHAKLAHLAHDLPVKSFN